MKKLLTPIFTLTLLFLAVFQSINVKAETSIGVTPPYIESENLIPGSTYRQEIVLSKSGSTNDATAEIDTGDSELAPWLSFEPGTTFDWGKDESQKKITAIVKIPDNAAEKLYTSSIRVKLTEKNAKGQVVIVPGVRIDINLRVGNERFSELEIRTARIEDFQSNEPLKVVFMIKNKGNIADNFKSVTLNITDLNSKLIETLKAEDTNIPKVNEFSTQEITVEFPEHNLGAGQYFAELTAKNEQNNTFETKISFNVNPVPESSSSSAANKNGLLTKPITYYAIGFGILLLIIIAYIIFVLKNKKSGKNGGDKEPPANVPQTPVSTEPPTSVNPSNSGPIQTTQSPTSSGLPPVSQPQVVLGQQSEQVNTGTNQINNDNIPPNN